MTAVAKGTLNGPPSLITVDPPTSCMIGPFGDQGGGGWSGGGGAGEDIQPGDVCYINADGTIMRSLEDQANLAAAINDVQTMSLVSNYPNAAANVNGGTYVLGYNAAYTPAISYNANSGTVQTAIQALATVGAGNITVSGTFPNFVFTGASAFAGIELDLIEVESSLIDPVDPQPYPVLTITHTTVGQPAGTGNPQSQSAVMGMATIKYRRGQPVTLYHNVIMNYSDGNLTPGQLLYLSSTVPGGLDTAPTLTGQKAVARAMDTQRIYVFSVTGP